MKEGGNLIGWGMATGIWDVQQSQASAKAKLSANGKLEVGSVGTADIGTGTYTVMTQIAAAAIGNAVYHATGKCVRDLPITIDKLL